MNTTRSLPFLLVLLLLAGCATYPQRQSDLAQMASRGVPPVLVERMRHGDVLTLPEIVTLARKRVGDDAILRYVRHSGGVYRLGTDDINRLQRSGVSPAVIDYLLRTPEFYAYRASYYDPFYYDSYRPWPGSYYPYYGGSHHHRHHGKKR